MKKLMILSMLVLVLTGCGKKETELTNSEPTNKKTSEVVTTTKTSEEETTESTTNTTKVTTAEMTTSTKSTKNTKTTKKTTKKTTTKSTTTTKKKTEKEVYQAMIALKAKYPDDTPWNNSNKYKWKGGKNETGYGCAGFAFMLSDAAFGSARARKTTDFDHIRVGDIIRLNDDTHSVIVLEVKSDGYIIAEGNVAGKVLWGSKVLKQEVKSSGTYVLTRW